MLVEIVDKDEDVDQNKNGETRGWTTVHPGGGNGH